MRDDMRAATLRFIAKNQLLNQGDRVIVALSGGADSVALLHVLISIKEELDITLYAAHFNHSIRGEEADRDERFVKTLCEQWMIPLYCERADVPAIAAETGESLELCGRRLRYRFFDRLSCELGGAKIATAHHSGDNAETVLWNLIRGSGIGGLSGIPVKRDNIIRPLLNVSRVAIERYCAENDLPYMTDSTNLSDEYTRNKLRHQVMPVLREMNPNAGENIGRTAVIMREADEYLNQISIKELNSAKSDHGWSCEKLLNLQSAVLKYAVKNILENAAAPVDFRHIELIIEAMRSGGAVNLRDGYTASCAQGTLRIVTGTVGEIGGFCVPFTEYMKSDGVPVRIHHGSIEPVDGCLKINNLLLNNCIPCDIITPDTMFRTRRAGDTFTDPRRGVTKTLKKLFNELKIPRELRDGIPVVADGSTVLWVQGVGVSVQALPDMTRDGELIYMGDNHA